MSSSLPDEMIRQLAPLLGSVARLVARGFEPGDDEFQTLLEGAGIPDQADIRDELRRWTTLLTKLRRQPSEVLQLATSEALLIRGLPEAPVTLAVGIVCAAAQTPSSAQAARPSHLAASVERIDLGTLAPGQAAVAEFDVSGGPGRIMVESDQVVVSPDEFGAGGARIRVEVKPLQAGLLWTMLRLEAGTNSLDLPLMAQWLGPTPSIHSPISGIEATPPVSPPYLITGTSSVILPTEALSAAEAVVAALQGSSTSDPSVHRSPHPQAVTVGSGAPSFPAPGRATPLLAQRGYHLAPALARQGMSKRLGRGQVQELFPLDADRVLLITGGGATVLDLHARQVLWELDYPATCGALSPDLTLIALGSTDGIVLWDAKTVSVAHTLTEHSAQLSSLAFSPDGLNLFSASLDGVVHIYDIAGRMTTQTRLGHAGPVHILAIAPDSCLAASAADDNIIRLWDVPGTGAVLRLEGHSAAVSAVAFSLDARLLASASQDKMVVLWDVENGKMRSRLQGHEGAVAAVAFDPSGRLIASGSDRTIHLWDVETGRELRQLTGHAALVKKLAFSPDGRFLFSAGLDSTILQWQLPEGALLRRQEPATSAAQCLAFGPGGLIAVGGGDGLLRLWDVGSGHEVARFEGHTDQINSVAFGSRDQVLASGSDDGTMRLWNAKSGKQIWSLEDHSGPVLSIALSFDGLLLASANADGKVRICTTSAGQLQQKIPRNANHLTGHVSFSPDGLNIAFDGARHAIHLWNLRGGLELSCGDGPAEITALSYSPSGRALAAGRANGLIQLWDVERRRWRAPRGQELLQFMAHPGGVTTMAFDSGAQLGWQDDQLLATAGMDYTIRLWNLNNSAEVLRLKSAHAGIVNSLEFSPTDRILASASEDGTVRLWQIDKKL